VLATQLALNDSFEQQFRCDLQTNSHHKTSKVLRLSRKINLDLSQVLRLQHQKQLAQTVQ
jgi:hypothetical protein